MVSLGSDNKSGMRLSESLEDYIEAIHKLIQEKKVARVKDIARLKGVRMASVSDAMRKLGERGLVKYEAREYIELTPEGTELARKVRVRHELLHWFFKDLLRVSAVNSEKDACTVEHALSDEGVDKLVKLYEYFHLHPERQKKLLEFLDAGSSSSNGPYVLPSVCTDKARLSDLKPGQSAKVLQIRSKGAVRQRLIDMGMLPDTQIFLERKAPTGDPIWIRMKGFQLSLRLSEADDVQVCLIDAFKDSPSESEA